MFNQANQLKINSFFVTSNKNSLIYITIQQMTQTLFTCVNCQLHFENESIYREHYKSQHHRYNVKRKLIGLPPLSFQDYTIQFQVDKSSKSQSQAQIYCQLCSKKFMSVQTYKQHINSQKHKQNRKNLLKVSKKDIQNKSETSSLSQFQLIDTDQKLSCLFCNDSCSQSHLFQKHSFPPFKSQCINLTGLVSYVRQIVKKGTCIYCQQEFGSQDSVKQHMADTGHGHLDIDAFQQFQAFYLWKIQENTHEEEEQESSEEKMDVIENIENLDNIEKQSSSQIQVLENTEDNPEFSILKGQTLKSLQQKRQNRIKHTATGVLINGKEVGYRAYKQYYKQYLTRTVQQAPREHQKCLPVSQDWKKHQKHIQPKPQFPSISFNINTR